LSALPLAVCASWGGTEERTCRNPNFTQQPFLNHAPTNLNPNHDSIILRVESKNDSDSTMHKQKTARQICTPVATALRLAYGSGDMRLFQRTAQKQPLRDPTQILSV